MGVGDWVMKFLGIRRSLENIVRVFSVKTHSKP